MGLLEKHREEVLVVLGVSRRNTFLMTFRDCRKDINCFSGYLLYSTDAPRKGTVC